jgi:MFS transporter, FSR family, fosmidomycin resistance protein
VHDVIADIPAQDRTAAAKQKKTLVGACLAHALHDGYTDQLYALLPVWQAQFGLSYAGLAIVRAIYYGTMGGLQLSADRIGARFTPRAALALATAIAAIGYLVVGFSGGFAGLCFGLFIAGLGSSVQHPRASAVVAATYPKDHRGPLGVYNFAGDLGKAAFPAAIALLLPRIGWRPAVTVSAGVGLLVAIALLVLLPRRLDARSAEQAVAGRAGDGRGFRLLLTIGTFDTAARMGYLLFLPFLVHAKGGQDESVGIALAVLFIGGALGKACCGWLGQRLGVIWTVTLTEAATAVLILTTLVLPLWGTFVVLPLLGIVLNGTSSVLYGTVPELARDGDIGRAFALFYTGVIGAGGLAPIGYGFLADHSNTMVGVAAAAVTAAAIIPMVMRMQRFLEK